MDFSTSSSVLDGLVQTGNGFVVSSELADSVRAAGDEVDVFGFASLDEVRAG